ncbi:poly(ethylene terephthalate) hydrolase family protein [Streptomyces sp. NBC_00663]|uniref:poly(ethylene terephthalate) hydrolase family protein n=1 Tax=Streptomyces sp. NBC_00663 TaxID=2975801 RepID=UPI003FCEC237
MPPSVTGIPVAAKLRAVVVMAVLGLIAALFSLQPASAADNPYQRGPDPTVSSVAAQRGTFATSQISVPPGNGFNGAKIYYPTDTSLGTWGAVAVVPGYTAKWDAVLDRHEAGRSLSVEALAPSPTYRNCTPG